MKHSIGTLLLFLIWAACTVCYRTARGAEPEHAGLKGVRYAIHLKMHYQTAIEDPCRVDSESSSPRFMIFWNDGPSIDGAFILAIHPSQVILRSSHDNPNPDFVYWNVPISLVQYKAISHTLESHNGSEFSSKAVWSWPGYKVMEFTRNLTSPWCPELESQRPEWESERSRILNENVHRIFTKLNAQLPKNVPQLHAPTTEVATPFAFISNNRKYPESTFASRRQDME